MAGQLPVIHGRICIMTCITWLHTNAHCTLTHTCMRAHTHTHTHIHTHTHTHTHTLPHACTQWLHKNKPQMYFTSFIQNYAHEPELMKLSHNYTFTPILFQSDTGVQFNNRCQLTWTCCGFAVQWRSSWWWGCTPDHQVPALPLVQCW